MAYTLLKTVNAVGADEEIIVQTVCKSVAFVEDPSVAGWPTVDWLWRATDSAEYATRTAGTSQLFTKPGGAWYMPGERVAYVKTATGSSSFQQVEQ